MTTPGIIIEIKNRYNSMNPAMQQISDYLMTHYEDAAFQGIHDIARNSGVSAASVTGFVKEMGFKNYKAFQLAIAMSIGQNNHVNEEDNAPFIYGGISENDGMGEICRKVFRTSIQMLTDTLSIVDTDGMQRVSEYILKAPKIIFFGVGRSYLAAESGKSRFYRMGLNCFCYRDSHEQIVGASMCGKGDVVISVSNYGRSRSVVEATRLAKSRGAVTIGITSAKNSPLANAVDFPFFSVSSIDNLNINSNDMSAFEPSSENVAQIVLLDCLYMYVALREKEKIVEKYYETTKALEVERL